MHNDNKMKSHSYIIQLISKITLLLLLIDANAVYAQQKIGQNATVAVVPFSTSFSQDTDDADYSRMLTEIILTAFVQSQRFIMVDFTDLEKSLGVIKHQDENSQDYSKWENEKLAHLVTAGKRLGIEFIFTGNITNVSTPILVTGNYGAEFGFTIKAISVESGRLYVTESFAVNLSGVGKIGKASKKEALNAALQNVNEPVMKFIDRYFPVEARFYKIRESDKKGMPKLVVISSGLSSGLRNKQVLDVVIKEIDAQGATYRNKIGEVEIIEIEANFATCKVKKGADEILKANSEQKDHLFVQSKAYD
jgi:TolB-like protein